jgi:6-phosphogluconolactonase
MKWLIATGLAAVGILGAGCGVERTVEEETPLVDVSAAPIVTICGISGTLQELVVAHFDARKGEAAFSESQRLPLGFVAEAITYSPRHRKVYVASHADVTNDVPNGLVFSVDEKGVLTEETSLSFTHGYSFLELDRSGSYLMGASYVTGFVDVYALGEKGIPVEVYTGDQNRIHAHAIATTPDNRFAYVPYVKKSNALYQYAFDAKTGKLSALEPAQARVGDPAGPRHMAFHPSKPFVYFSNEQQLGVSVYQRDDQGRLELVQICAALELTMTKGVDASGIVITPDGKFVLCAVRGFVDATHDMIVSYKVLENGHLEALGRTPTDPVPWVLSLTPNGKVLLVSAARGKTLTAFAIGSDGGLTRLASIEWGPEFWDMVAY